MAFGLWAMRLKAKPEPQFEAGPVLLKRMHLAGVGELLGGCWDLIR